MVSVFFRYVRQIWTERIRGRCPLQRCLTIRKQSGVFHERQTAFYFWDRLPVGGYFTRVLQKRMKIAAPCARVVPESGTRLLPLPCTMPWATAHFIAGSA